jgi:hypothetical protein
MHQIIFICFTVRLEPKKFENHCVTATDITPCSPMKVNRRFGGTYLHKTTILSVVLYGCGIQLPVLKKQYKLQFFYLIGKYLI